MVKRRAPSREPKPSNDLTPIDKVRQRLDNMGLEDSSFWKPKEGRNVIRILPGVDDMGDFFWQVVGKHYIPGGRAAAICPRVTLDEPCPICEYVDALYRQGDKASKEFAKKIRAQRQYWMSIINRDNEKAGPVIYSAAKTVFSAIATLVRDPDYGEVYDIDTGTDVIVTRTGTGLETRYQVQAKRKESPLSKDDATIDDWVDAQVDLTPIELSFDPDEDGEYTRDEDGNRIGIVYVKPYDRLQDEFESLLEGSPGDEEDEDDEELPPMDDDEEEVSETRKVIQRRRKRRSRR